MKIYAYLRKVPFLNDIALHHLERFILIHISKNYQFIVLIYRGIESFLFAVVGRYYER